MKKRVVVVGAGVVGLFCAVRLAQSGAAVTVLEAEREHPDVHGPTASAAAAGMLAPVEGEPSPHEGIALQSLGLWRRWRERAHWADGVRFDGVIVVRETADEATLFAANVRRLGLPWEALSLAQASRRLGLEARAGHALFLADEGTADPLRVLTGLAMQARSLGVAIEYQRDVAKATPTLVETLDDRVYEADSVVLAPGVWATDSLVTSAPALKHIRPAKGHVASVVTSRMLKENLRAPDFYIAQRREDVVLGSTLEWDRFDRRVDKALVADMQQRVERVFPGQVRLGERAWAGIRPMSPDGWPIIGPDGKGVLVAAGHSRNGWLLAPVTAEIITSYVFGAEIPAPWAALSPERFGLS